MSAQPIKIAILAMGGEGGGVLADWLVDLGETHGYIAQSTSVPGVAQRTGATIYYVELYPGVQASQDGGVPVLALMPLPGDVDLVVASELMEAGRAVQRGLVTPDRTTLVASTHRVYSIVEKSAMADGRVESDALLAHADAAAKRFIRFDMERAAAETGSVISAVLFGAVAGSGVLPFSREQCEATIRRGGVGVKPSLAAFDAAFVRVGREEVDDAPPAATFTVGEPRDPAIKALLARSRSSFPAAAQRFLIEGLRRLIDYQDLAYATLYLDRMAPVAAAGDDELTVETARHLVLWMSYEDTIRVADLKTRDTRFARVAAEVKVRGDQVVAIHEFMHPGLREICETLPAWLGRWLRDTRWVSRRIEALTRQGRIVETSSIRGFVLLYVVAGMKRWRRSTLRYADEQRGIEGWLQRIVMAAAIDPRLAIEIAKCQKLVKGYSDTHERGARNFGTLMSAIDKAGATIAPATIRDLRDAALADEHGTQLKAALQRHALA